MILTAQPELAGSRCQLLAAGWDCLGVDVDDCFVFKVRRDEEAATALEGEGRLLDLIRPAVTLPVPCSKPEPVKRGTRNASRRSGGRTSVGRFAVLCNDTRGGVQPYVALAAGLKAAGHDVRAVAPSALAGLFEAHAIPVASLAGSGDAMAFAAGGIAEKGTLATFRLMRRALPRQLLAWTRTALEACEGAERLVGGLGGMVIGLPVAERLGLPFVAAHLQPVAAPASAYPGVLWPNVPSWTGGLGRRLSHHLSDLALWMPFAGAMNQVQRGLAGRDPAVEHRLPPTPTLYGFSKFVVPVPPAPGRHVTGYWSLPASPDWAPPAGLERFLSDERRPVVSVGFGSMGSADPEALARLAVAAAREVGAKIVLLGGWSGLRAPEASEGTEADDVYLVDDAPHDWLFPRLGAVVYHGGAGTTGAAIAAGVPAVVVPFAVDQGFWAQRVAQLGVGPKPVPRRQLTSARLARALDQALHDPTMAARAAELGARLREEAGVARAVEVLSRDVERGPRPERA